MTKKAKAIKEDSLVYFYLQKLLKPFSKVRASIFKVRPRPRPQLRYVSRRLSRSAAGQEDD